MATINKVIVELVADGTKYVATLKQVAAQTQQVASGISSSMGKTAKGFDQAGKAAKSMDSNINGLVKRMGTLLIQAATVYLGVGALFKAIGGVVGELRDFDEQLRNIQSITLDTDQATRQLAESLLKMTLSGRSWGQSASAMASSMYQIVQAGYDTAESMHIAEVAAQGAAAGLTTADVAGRALVTVLQAYRRPVGDADEIMSHLFTIVDKGVITFEELATNIGYVIPSAAGLGIGLDELGAGIELLTRQGQLPSRVMTNLNAVMTALLKPSGALKAVMKDLGYESGTAMVASLGFAGTLQKINEAAGGSADKLAQWFGNVRAIRAVLPLAEDNGMHFVAMLKEHNEMAGSGTRHLMALEHQQKSFNFQTKLLTSNLLALGVIAISPLLGLFAKLFKELNGLFQQLVVVNKQTGEMIFIWEKHQKTFNDVKKVLEAVAILIGVRLVGAFAAIIRSLNLVEVAAKFITRFVTPWTLLVTAIILVAQELGILDDIIRFLTTNKAAIDFIKGLALAFTALQLAALASKVAMSQVAAVMVFKNASSILTTLQMMSQSLFSNATMATKLADTRAGLGLMFGSLKAGITSFLTSGPGMVIILAAIYMGLQQIAQWSGGESLQKLKDSLDDFMEAMERIDAYDFDENTKQMLKLSEAMGMIDESARITADGLRDFAEFDWSTSDFKEWLGDAASIITSGFGLIGDSASSEEKVIKQFKENVNQAIKELDTEGLRSLADQLYQLSQDPELADFADVFQDAERAVWDQYTALVEAEKAQIAVRVATGETTEEIEEGNKQLDKTVERVEKWANNLKPVQEYLKNILGMMTVEDAQSEAQIANLNLRVAAMQDAVDAEVALRDAAVDRIETEIEGEREIIDGIRDRIADARKIKADSDEQKAAKEALINGLEAEVDLHQEIIDKLNDEKEAEKEKVGPSEAAQNALKGQLEGVERIAELRRLEGEYIAANQQLLIVQKMAQDGLVLSEKERNFLLQSASAIWSNDLVAVQKIADAMGISKDRVNELTNGALEALTALSDNAVQAKMIADDLGLAPEHVQALMDLLPQAGVLTDDAKKKFQEMAEKLGIAPEKVEDLLKKLDEVKGLNIRPNVDTTEIDAAIRKVEELTGLSAADFAGMGQPTSGVYGQQHGARDYLVGAQKGLRNMMGGIVKVGEAGSELVFLPRGASVSSHEKTSAIMDNLAGMRKHQFGGGSANVNAVFNLAAPTIDEIIKKLHRSVDDLDRQMRFRSLRGGAPLSSGIT